MPNYLITGGLSIFSIRLAEILTTEKHGKIVVVHNFCDGFNKISIKLKQHPNVELINGDNQNETLIQQIIDRYSIDKVFDCSLKNEIIRKDPIESAAKLLLGITNVLDAIRHSSHRPSLLLISGEQVYGRATCRDETQPLEPIDFVGAAQMSVEAMAHSYSISYRVPIIIARLSQFLYSTRRDLFDDQLRRETSHQQFINILELDEAVQAVRKLSNLDSNQFESAEVFNVTNSLDLNFDELKNETGVVETRSSTRCSTKIHKFTGWQCSSTKFVEHEELTTAVEPHLLIYGESSDEHEFVQFLQASSKNFTKSKIDLSSAKDSEVLDEISQVLPSHLVYFSTSPSDDQHFDGGDSFTLRFNVSKNLYIPCLLASVAERQSIRLIHIQTIDNNQESQVSTTTTSDSSASAAVKSHTTKMLRHFENTTQIKLNHRHHQNDDDNVEKIQKQWPSRVFDGAILLKTS